MKFIVGLFIVFLLYKCIFSPDSIKANATYDVYYWRNLEANNPSDEKYIGTTDSAASCQSMAETHAKKIYETFHYRSYICLKKVNGRTYKLRYGEPE